MTAKRCPRCVRWRRRLALQMFEMGRSYKEMADALEITPSAARRLYLSALKYRAKEREQEAAHNVYAFKRKRAA